MKTLARHMSLADCTIVARFLRDEPLWPLITAILKLRLGLRRIPE